MASSEPPLLTDPLRLLLDMARESNVDEVLQRFVSTLGHADKGALARVWLTRRTQDCSNCEAPQICRHQTHCLRLVASCGHSIVDPGREWDDIHGAFSRIPIGTLKVGRIAASGEPLEVPDFSEKIPPWVAHPDWIRTEGIQGFVGQPLIHHGKTLGVAAVFARQPIGSKSLEWMRTIADHMAAAIATAQAFDEINKLRNQLELENEYLREEVTGVGAFGDLIGQSPALESVLRQINLVSPTDSGVLIQGESGTGKELVAREIHLRSRRSTRPMIKVNCAAVPRELFESEFFGHVKGAFTGALRDRVGRFELAEGGTLFLDEVGEIPYELQSKLLRVLQEGEIERVGEARVRRVDIRVIAATNRDLLAEADAGRFRKDLYYRLSVFPIEVPPLRQRREDIPLLAEHFLQSQVRKAGRSVPILTMATVQRLQSYDWPGNVRELQHVIERSVITSPSGRLNVELPASTRDKSFSEESIESEALRTDAQIRQLEIDNIHRALKRANNKISGPGGAAELLGLKPTTLASRIKALGITR